jgi:hypothetical protein
MIENSKKKLFSDSCMLCNLLFVEIKKFEFPLFCKKNLKNGKTAITFAYDVGKKRTIYQKARTLVTTLVCICLMRGVYFVGTLYFSSAHHLTILGILSYAFSKVNGNICRSFFCTLYLSIRLRSKKILSIVDLLGIKPN